MKDLHNNIFFRFVTSYKTYSFFKSALDVYCSYKNIQRLKGLVHLDELTGIILRYTPAFFENNSTLYVFLIRIAVLCDRYKDIKLKHSFLQMSLTSMDSLIKAHVNYGLPMYNKYLSVTEWQNTMRTRINSGDLFLFCLARGAKNKDQVITRSSHVSLVPSFVSDPSIHTLGTKVAMIRDCQPGRRRHLNFPREYQFSSISTRTKQDCSSLMIMPYLSMFSAAIWLNLLEWESDQELLSFNLIRGNKAFRTLCNSMKQFRIDQDVLRLFIIRMLIDFNSLELDIRKKTNLGFSYVCYLLRQCGYIDSIIIYTLKLPYVLSFDAGNYEQELREIPELVDQLSNGLTEDPASSQFLNCELYKDIIEKKFTGCPVEEEKEQDPLMEIIPTELDAQITTKLPIEIPGDDNTYVNIQPKYPSATLFQLIKSDKIGYMKLDEYSANVIKYASKLDATKLLTINSDTKTSVPSILDYEAMATDTTVRIDIHSIKDVIIFNRASVEAQKSGELVINPLMGIEPTQYIRLVDKRFSNYFEFMSVITVKSDNGALEISQTLYDSENLSNSKALNGDESYKFQRNCIKTRISPMAWNSECTAELTYMAMSNITSSESCSSELLIIFKKINIFIFSLYQKQFVHFGINSASLMQIMLDTDMIISVARFDLTRCNSEDVQVVAAELIALFDGKESDNSSPKIQDILELCLTISELNLFKGIESTIATSSSRKVSDYRSFSRNREMQRLIGIVSEYLRAIVHIMQNIRLYQLQSDIHIMATRLQYEIFQTFTMKEYIMELYQKFMQLKIASTPARNALGLDGRMQNNVTLDHFSFLERTMSLPIDTSEIE